MSRLGPSWNRSEPRSGGGARGATSLQHLGDSATFDYGSSPGHRPRLHGRSHIYDYVRRIRERPGRDRSRRRILWDDCNFLNPGVSKALHGAPIRRNRRIPGTRDEVRSAPLTANAVSETGQQPPEAEAEAARAGTFVRSPEAGAKAIHGGVIRGPDTPAGVALTAAASVLLLRSLGVVEFGRYVTVMSLIAVVSGIADAGLTAVATRELATRRLESERWALMRNLVGLRLILTPVGCCSPRSSRSPSVQRHARPGHPPRRARPRAGRRPNDADPSALGRPPHRGSDRVRAGAGQSSSSSGSSCFSSSAPSSSPSSRSRSSSVSSLSLRRPSCSAGASPGGQPSSAGVALAPARGAPDRSRPRDEHHLLPPSSS